MEGGSTNDFQYDLLSNLLVLPLLFFLRMGSGSHLSCGGPRQNRQQGLSEWPGMPGLRVRGTCRFSLTGYLQQSGLYLNDFSLFVSGVLLATLVELIAGWLMDKCFHARWWDYSDKPLNFHGYICLEFSLIWGVCVLLAVRLLQAYVASRHIVHDPSTFGCVVLIIFYSTLAADLFVTILVLRGFNKTLTKLDSIHPGRGCNSWSRIPGISHLLFPHESPPIHLHHRALMTCLATP